MRPPIESRGSLHLLKGVEVVEAEHLGQRGEVVHAIQTEQPVCGRTHLGAHQAVALELVGRHRHEGGHVGAIGGAGGHNPIAVAIEVEGTDSGETHRTNRVLSTHMEHFAHLCWGRAVLGNEDHHSQLGHL